MLYQLLGGQWVLADKSRSVRLRCHQEVVQLQVTRLLHMSETVLDGCQVKGATEEVAQIMLLPAAKLEREQTGEHLHRERIKCLEASADRCRLKEVRQELTEQVMSVPGNHLVQVGSAEPQ